MTIKKINFSSIVNSAMYGKNGTYISVGNIISDLINQGTNIIQIENDVFLNDPVPNVVKDLLITIDSVSYTLVEHDTLMFYGNEFIINNISLDPLSLSTIFDCNKYNNCIITHEDSAYTNIDSILIFASMEYIDSNAINSAINPIDSTNIGDYKYINNVGNFVYIGKLQPTSLSSILAIPRFESLNISLNVFNCIYILNASGDIITNVKCSLFST